MSNAYQPSYNTEITTKTVVHRLPTMHLDHIDWDFPFDYADFPFYRGGNLAQIIQQEHIERLKICEKPNAWASHYHAQPYLYRVLKVGMASTPPFWEPRPTVLLDGPHGVEWVDWVDLTGAETR